jgi:tetratricopeptide (TPR) repeat protein
MKEKLLRHATFCRYLSIVVCLAHLLGCTASKGVPESQIRKAQALVDVGTGFLRERRVVEARKAFQLAAELAPLAAAVDGLGCVALLEGAYDSAEGYFVEAYEMDRTYDEALINLALLRELQGESAGAEAIYMKYLMKNPSSAIARNNLAALEYDKGRRRIEAIEALERAIVLSNQAVIRDNLIALRER